MRDAREQQAWDEVGHTAVKPRLARLIVAWFAVTMVALPAAEWLGGPATRDGMGGGTPWASLMKLPGTLRATLTRPAQAPDGSIFWDRVVPANRQMLSAAAAFEDALEDRSAVGSTLRPPVQALLTEWLGGGNERVYVGRDGWLFYRSDVESVAGPGFLDASSLAQRRRRADAAGTPVAADPRPAIVGLARQLQARDIALVIVPTPVKPTIHPDRLTNRVTAAAAPLHNASYAQWMDDLQRAGVVVFDPTPVLLAAAEADGAAYLATDTHWRPQAMQAVAQALAVFLGARTSLPSAGDPGYRVEPRAARQAGDTAAMLDLPARSRASRVETVDLQMVLGADGDPWRPTRGADVLVLGDSFSNIYSLAAMGWGEAAGFVEHLSLALRRPVDRLVQNDNGASATRLILARDPARLATVRVVVWQFAARELTSGDWPEVSLEPQ